MKRKIIAASLLLSALHCAGQVNVAPNLTATQMAQKLVGSGVTVFNASLFCPTNASGSFTVVSSNLGLDSGIVLTTGRAQSAGTTIGANSNPSLFASTNCGFFGDADLNTIGATTTHDGCKLEFDLIPNGDSIQFDYVFGSEEYNGIHGNYNCAINDLFAFLISGPGITGAQNIALIPNTNVPVGVSTVNDGIGAAPGNACYNNTNNNGPYTQYYNYNWGSTITYSGFTSSFTARKEVMPCSTYHLKLVIADAVDYIYDSGVFIRAGSLSSTPIAVNTNPGSTTAGVLTTPVPYCVRGCLPGKFKFERSAPTSNPLTIKFQIQGSAMNGTDYSFLPDSVTIAANDSVAFAVVNGLPANPATGPKTVKLRIYNPYSCSGAPSIIDSAQLTLYDSLYIDASATNPAVCAGQTVQIQTIGESFFNYSWSPAAGLSNPSGQNPVATVSGNVTYQVTATMPGSTCPAVHDTVSVGLPAAPPAIGSNGPLCIGSTLNLSVGAVPGATYSWTGPNGFTSSLQNPVITNAQPAHSGLYSVTTTVAGCTSTPATVNVSVSAAPAITSALPSDPTTCNGTDGSISLTGLGSNVSYTISYSKNGVAQAPLTITSSSAGVAVLPGLSAGSYSNIQASVSSCSSSAAGPVVLYSPAAPAITSALPSDPTTCNGTDGSISLTGLGSNISYTISYSKNGTAQAPVTITSNSAGVAVLPNLGAGSYSNIQASVSGCSASATGPVVLSSPAAPQPPVLSSNGPLCAGNSLQLNASSIPGAVYSWTGPGGFTSSLQNPVINNITSSQAGTYSVTVTANNCVSNPVATTVTVNAVPAAPAASSNGPVCENATLTLTATGQNLLWYTTATGGAGSAATPVPSTATAGTTTWYVSQTVNGCESQRTAVTGTVTALPAAPAAVSPAPYCEGAAAAALIATGQNLLWYTAATGGTGSNTAPTPSTAAAGSTTWYVSQTVNGCEGPRTPVMATVNAQPAAPVTSPASFCQGTTATALTATGQNLLWYTSAAGGTGTATAPVPSTAANGSSTWYVSQTVNGCESQRQPLTVSITSQAPAPLATTQINYCEGALPVALSASGQSLLWYTSPSGGSGSATAPTPSTAVPGNATWYVSQTISGCESPRLAINVDVFALPAAPIAASPAPYCQGSTAATLSAAGQNLLWYTGAAGGTGSGTAPTPSTAAAGITTWYVSQTVNGCESPRTPVSATVNAQPSAPVTSPASFCQGTTATSLSAAGQNLLWYTSATGGTGTGTAPVPSTAVNGSTTWYVSQTVNGCESQRQPLTVSITSQAPAPLATTQINYCAGAAPVALSATGQNLLWYTAPSGGSGSAAAPTPSTAAPGNATWYVSQTISGCESPRVAINVDVFAVPGAPATVAPAPYCEGAAAASLNASGQNLLWYTAATGGTGSNTAPVPSTASAGITTWYVSQSVNGCESPRASLQVTVNALPAAPLTTGMASYCQGSTALALSATGTGLLWYSSPTGGTGLATPPVPSTAATGTTTWYVSQTVNGCESPRAADTVQVLNTPATPVVTAPASFCEGSVAGSLNSYVSGSSLLWYTSPAGGTGSATPPAINTNAPGNTTYYVSQAAGSCESPRAAVAVSVVAKPLPPVTANIAYCEGEPATVLSATGQNIQWYTSATGGSGSTAVVTPNTGAAGSTTWYFSQTVNGCESDRVPLTVTVNAKPQPPAVTGNNTAYCQFATPVQLSASGQNLKWYTQPSGGSPLAGAPTPSTAASGTSSWYVSQTVGGCESNRVPLSVQVNEKPDAPIINNPLPYCQGDASVPLNVAIGQNLLWYASAAGGVGSPVAPTPNTASPGSQTYFVSQTVTGCESDRSVVPIQVNQLPFSSIVVSRDTLCALDTLSITSHGSNPSATSYTWNFAGATVLSGTGSGPYIVKWNDEGNKVITVIANHMNCLAADSRQLVIKPSIDPSFVLKDHSCVDETLEVQAAWNSISEVNYIWDFDGAQVLSGTGAGYYSLKWQEPGTRVVKLQTGYRGCTSPVFADTIEVHELPEAKILTRINGPVCSGEPLQMEAQQSGSAGHYSYSWGPEPLVVSNGSSSARIKISKSGYYTLNMSDAYGCSSRDSIWLETRPCCEVAFPDAFTPNGDGRNDLFRAIGAGDHAPYALRILNRWGQTVFSTVNEDDGWDGTFGGARQDVGTYYYMVSYHCNGEKMEVKGEVALIR